MNATKDLNLSGSKAKQNDMEQIQKTENNMKTLHEKKQETYEKRIWKQNLSRKTFLRKQPTQPIQPIRRISTQKRRLCRQVAGGCPRSKSPRTRTCSLFAATVSLIFPQFSPGVHSLCLLKISQVMIFPWHSNILKVNFKWLHIDRNCKPPQQGHLIIINFHKSYENHIKNHYPKPQLYKPTIKHHHLPAWLSVCKARNTVETRRWSSVGWLLQILMSWWLLLTNCKKMPLSSFISLIIYIEHI